MQLINVIQDALKEITLIHLKKEFIIKPNYSHINLANVGSTILKFLGFESSLSQPLHEVAPYKKLLEDAIKPRKNKLLTILVNSLSTSLQSKLLNNLSPLCENILQGIVTSTFPSITPTALMTLYTGLPPLTHGVLGFEFFHEKLKEVVKPFKLNMSMGKNNLESIFGSPPNIFNEASKVKINPIAFMPYPLSDNPATKYMLKGAKIITYISLRNITQLTITSSRLPLFYIYYSKLDEIVHREGSFTSNVFNVLKELETYIEFLLRKKFQIFLLSDHSHLDLEGTVNTNMPSYFQVADNGGRVLYIRGSEKSSICEKEGFSIFPSEHLIGEEWFGNGGFSERIGQKILIARRKNGLTFHDRKIDYKATHGGWSMEEMITPFTLLTPLKT